MMDASPLELEYRHLSIFVSSLGQHSRQKASHFLGIRVPLVHFVRSTSTYDTGRQHPLPPRHLHIHRSTQLLTSILNKPPRCTSSLQGPPSKTPLPASGQHSHPHPPLLRNNLLLQ